MIFSKPILQLSSFASLLSISILTCATVPAEKVYAYNVSGDSRCQDNGSTAVCMINEPPVGQWFTKIPSIRFDPGDQVLIEAGGCVQSGGSGKTWKRYVNPYAPDAPDRYHGLIYIPGFGNLVRLLDVNGRTFTVPQIPSNTTSFLVLGYEDGLRNYGDNGYWGHDNGTGNQCRNVGNAWVKLTIRRR